MIWYIIVGNSTHRGFKPFGSVSLCSSVIFNCYLVAYHHTVHIQYKQFGSKQNFCCCCVCVQMRAQRFMRKTALKGTLFPSFFSQRFKARKSDDNLLTWFHHSLFCNSVVSTMNYNHQKALQENLLFDPMHQNKLANCRVSKTSDIKPTTRITEENRIYGDRRHPVSW